MKIIAGLLAAGMGAMIALYGYVRLGIGRHGEAWWKPFTNDLSFAHFANLTCLVVGVGAVVMGALLVISAFRRG